MASSASTIGTATSSPAPEIQIPPVRVHSVEYPGYVQPTSIPEAIRTLGGQQALEKAFRKTSKPDAFLELRYRPDNPFAHPIAGEVVQTNSVLLRVVKRRRKRAEGTPTGGQDPGPIGEYIVEPVGLIPGTARFRGNFSSQVWFLSLGYLMRPRPGLADYQYNPDPEDPVSKLRMAMENLDGQYRNYGMTAYEPHFFQSTQSENLSFLKKRKTIPYLWIQMPCQSIQNYLENPRLQRRR